MFLACRQKEGTQNALLCAAWIIDVSSSRMHVMIACNDVRSSDPCS